MVTRSNKDSNKNTKAYQGAITDIKGYVTSEQMDRVLDSIRKGRSTYWLRDHTFMLTLFRSGRRLSELLSLKLSDIDFDMNTIVWNILKKKKKLSVVKSLDSFTLKQLHKYAYKNSVYLAHKARLNGLNEDDIENNDVKLFPFTRSWGFKLVRKHFRDCGITRIGTKSPHPHHLRHGFSVHFLRHTNRNEAIRILQTELEHSSIDVTSTYLQFDQAAAQQIKEEIFVKNKKNG